MSCLPILPAQNRNALKFGTNQAGRLARLTLRPQFPLCARPPHSAISNEIEHKAIDIGTIEKDEEEAGDRPAKKESTY